uniref:Uncharacterized protein n=1 Tax=Oryza glumipatula TaxID=40148 RepID=A0A0E0BTW2_9ORYZ
METKRGNSGFFQDRHWGRLGLVLGRLQQTDAAGRLPSTDQNAAGAGKTEGGIPTGAISPTSTSPPPLHPSSPSVPPPPGSGASPRRAVAAESVVLGGVAVLPPPTMLRRCVPSRPRRLPLPDDHPLVAVFSFLFIPT